MYPHIYIFTYSCITIAVIAYIACRMCNWLTLFTKPVSTTKKITGGFSGRDPKTCATVCYQIYLVRPSNREFEVHLKRGSVGSVFKMLPDDTKWSCAGFWWSFQSSDVPWNFLWLSHIHGKKRHAKLNLEGIQMFIAQTIPGNHKQLSGSSSNPWIWLERDSMESGIPPSWTSAQGPSHGRNHEIVKPFPQHVSFLMLLKDTEESSKTRRVRTWAATASQSSVHYRWRWVIYFLVDVTKNFKVLNRIKLFWG